MSTIKELQREYQRLQAERNYEVNAIFGLRDQVDFVHDCLNNKSQNSQSYIIKRQCSSSYNNRQVGRQLSYQDGAGKQQSNCQQEGGCHVSNCQDFKMYDAQEDPQSGTISLCSSDSVEQHQDKNCEDAIMAVDQDAQLPRQQYSESSDQATTNSSRQPSPLFKYNKCNEQFNEQDLQSPSFELKSQHLYGFEIKPSLESSEYSAIMVDRWLKSHQNLPQIDKDDLSNESIFLNGGVLREHYNQDNPEVTQQAYLRIRALEESYQTFNYLCQSSNPGYKAYLMQVEQEKANPKNQVKRRKHIVTQFDRSYGIQKIFDLHIKKQYRIETLFIAASIFDRYLASVGHWNFPREHICRLSTVSILIAAKLEQPIAPSFARMILNLSEDEQKNVKKEHLLDLEHKILVQLGFNVTFTGPVECMERYLRILNYDNNKIIYDMSYQICKFQLNESEFLAYRPSEVAACSVIISINIYKRDQEKYDEEHGLTDLGQRSFFDKSNRLNQLNEEQILLNTDIWDDDIVDLTGYSVERLKGNLLLKLANFIRQNLTPDRLQGFDIDD